MRDLFNVIFLYLNKLLCEITPFFRKKKKTEKRDELKKKQYLCQQHKTA